MNKIDWTTYPSELEDKIKWMLKHIPGTADSIEKYAPHWKHLLNG